MYNLHIKKYRCWKWLWIFPEMKKGKLVHHFKRTATRNEFIESASRRKASLHKRFIIERSIKPAYEAFRVIESDQFSLTVWHKNGGYQGVTEFTLIKAS